MKRGKKTLKNKLKYLRYRNLSNELANYGYEYTPKKALKGYFSIVLASCILGVLYKLEMPYMVVLVLFGMFLLPAVVLQTMKGKYNTTMFSLANNYIEQFLYAFKRTGTVLSSLREIEGLFDDEIFNAQLNKAIEHIVYETGSADAEEEALNMISEFFNCEKVDTVHSFVLEAQRRGGNIDGSISLLEKNRAMWVSRICNLQEEFRIIKRNVLFAIGMTLCICLLPLYLLGNNLDISTMTVCQVSAVVLILLCIVIYVKADKKLCRSWIGKSEKNEVISDKFIEVENYDEDTESKKSMKMALVPIIITGILFVWKQNMALLLIGIVIVVILLNQHKIGHALAKNKVKREIEKQFPEWLMQLVLLLQNDNVQIAIRKSLDTAPSVLVPAIERLIYELEDNPNSGRPYNQFLKDYHNAEVQSTMQMLYALSNGSFTDITRQIEELIDRNNVMMDKAEKLHQEDIIVGMKVYTLLPALLASFKLMVDMSLLLILFLENLSFGM